MEKSFNTHKTESSRWSTCIPVRAVCPSLVLLDSRAICRGSKQRSLQEDQHINTLRSHGPGPTQVQDSASAGTTGAAAGSISGTPAQHRSGQESPWLSSLGSDLSREKCNLTGKVPVLKPGGSCKCYTGFDRCPKTFIYALPNLKIATT